MKAKKNVIQKIEGTKIGKRLIQEQRFRAVYSAAISLLVNILYAFYHVVLGVVNQSLWFITMFAYYVILSAMRLSAVLCERKHKSSASEDTLGCRSVAAIVVCLILAVTAAAAAVPAVWEALQTQLGAFSPYAQTVRGAVCTDQGIELQVLGALSDDLDARIYFALRDVEQDRLDEFLALEGRLTAGEAHRAEGKDAQVVLGVGAPSTRYFKLLSYDPETKTALFSAGVNYGEDARPTREAELSIAGMTTRYGRMDGNHATASCAFVTGAALESLPAAEGDAVILTPGGVAGLGFDDDVLPREHVVLAPGQTPMEIAGTEEMRISSMGFASDGRLHIRLEFADGVAPQIYLPQGPASAGAAESLFYCDLRGGDSSDKRMYVVRETLVEGGMDILFPLLTKENLREIQDCEARFYGAYQRPGTDVEGNWSVQFELNYYPSVALDWSGELAGWQVRQVTISPLSVTMYSNASSGLHSTTLHAVKRDGSTVAAEPGSGRYANMDAVGGEGCDAFNTWKFVEPVDVADVVSLRLGDETIPVN